MRVMITGGTGFIGFHTAKALRAAGHELRALVRSATRGAEILGPLGLTSADLVEGDMADEAAVARALEGCDAVVHAAASVSLEARDAGRLLEQNLLGTQRVVGGAYARGVERIVHLSSLTALFDPFGPPVSETSPLVRSRTPYGASKVACDEFVRGLQDAGAPIASVYPGGVIGPEDPGFSESVRAYRSFHRNCLTCSGGLPSVDARDLGHIHTRLLEEKRSGRVIVAGHFTPWPEVADHIEAITGAEVGRIRAPGFAMRAMGALLDLSGRLGGPSSPLITLESQRIATLWKPIANSEVLAELGCELRPLDETFRDTSQWLLDEGRLKEEAVPKLQRRRPLRSSEG